MSYICPECGAYYCVKCYNALKEAENECWSCNTPLDESRPSIKSKEIGETKGKKKKSEIEVREVETRELIEAPKKGTKSDLTSLPTKQKSQLTIKATPIGKPEPQEQVSETMEAIEIYENYIAEIDLMLQELETDLSSGAISQEVYIEKKAIIEEKRIEAIAKRDQLRE